MQNVGINLPTKKKVDEHLGRLILVLLNLLAPILGAILRRSHERDPVHSILVLKFQGMGSLVIAKPALHHLRSSFPDAKIVFWGTKSTVDLARLMPEFDQFLTLNERTFFSATRSVIKCLFTIWREKVDWTFDLEVYSNLSAVIATLSCARNRAGFVVNQVPQRKDAFTHLLLFNRYEYLGNAYCHLLGLACGAPLHTALDFGNWKASDRARNLGLAGPHVVFNIHSGELSLERRWPREKFERLAEALLDAAPDLRIFLIGHGADEVAYNGLFLKHERILNFAGKLDLDMTVRLILNAELVVSNDTLPLHIAISGNGPVIGLFGPTRASTYFPVERKNGSAFSEKIYCAPCLHHWEPAPCGGNNQCMQLISEHEVLKRALSLLNIDCFVELPPTKARAITAFYPGLMRPRVWKAQ